MNNLPMIKITQQDYEKFLRKHKEVSIGGEKVRLSGSWNITNYAPPKDYDLEQETVWSFPKRGDWATHIGNYRGNWSPYIPRNLILKYTKKGDFVLDQMVGSGTTLVECKLLGRNAIGIDINHDAIIITKDRLNFAPNQMNEDHTESVIRTYVGDARNLNKIESESIDLIATHPPYAQIIQYTESKIKDDLSGLSIPKYLKEMHKVAEECARVLKPDRHCAILIGDIRSRRHYIPIGFRVMQQFLDVEFVIKEDIIKRQWKMKGTREKWRWKSHDFYLIAHEHLFIFRKLGIGEKPSKCKKSMKWW